MYKNLDIIQRANKTYISINSAKEFVQRCEKKNYAILGFEGLHITGNEIKPNLSLIADFSTLSSIRAHKELVKKSCRSAKEILDKFPREKNLYIEFVVKSDL